MGLSRRSIVHLGLLLALVAGGCSKKEPSPPASPAAAP